MALDEEIVKDTVSEYSESALARVVSNVATLGNSLYEDLSIITQSAEYCEFPSQNLISIIE